MPAIVKIREDDTSHKLIPDQRAAKRRPEITSLIITESCLQLTRPFLGRLDVKNIYSPAKRVSAKECSLGTSNSFDPLNIK